MINCFMLENEFFSKHKEFVDLNFIADKLDRSREKIYSYPLEAIEEIINKYSRIIGTRRELLSYEGVLFLALWLRKENIEKTLRLNFKDIRCLDEFIEEENDKFIRVQPKGIVCHFMAGNVPTLAIYSLFQAFLCKNASILRIPLESMKIVLELLKPLSDIKINYEGKEYYGKELLECACIIHFPSNDREMMIEMSLKADVRVIWGGEKAVNTITMLPKKTTCKDIVFGPKYSFAVFEKSALESQDLSKIFDAVSQDIIIFDQTACSSPQVLFIENSSLSLREVALLLEKSINKFSKNHQKVEITQSTAAKILNKRGEYLLSPDKDIICSKDLQYTILMDNEIRLEEPIHGRTIFLKEIDDIFKVCEFITPRIQTIGIAFEDKNRMIKFANKVSFKGVDRLVKVGCMNFYDSPWDGMLFMNEMVRYTTLNIK